MSQLAMPFILVNLGCEMIYILDQRLKAQNIPQDKGSKVLQDVVKTMFDIQYVEKLFTPQDMYSVSSTRKIFDKLAHSSIMRLSESSMDKLFDLMLMGVKYQVLCSTKLEDMLEVTLLHLSTVKALLVNYADASIVGLVSNMEDHMIKHYKPMTPGQKLLLRQTVLRFFQDRRVKVSLFLQEGIQSTMGRLILPTPVNSTVGTVTSYDLSGGVESQDKLKMGYNDMDKNEFFVHPCPLGTNLYNKDRPKVVPPPRKGDLVTGPAKPEEKEDAENKPNYGDEYVDKSGKARKELDLLTSLLAVKPPATDNFKLNLFGNDEPIVGSKLPVSAASASKVLKFEGKTSAGKLEGVMKELAVDGKDGEEEDLLDLLDAAK